MNHSELQKYWVRVTEGRPAEAKVIHPSSVVTGAWVRLKCQYGCTEYGKGYCCPPETPTPERTRMVLDSYHRAILFHFEAIKNADRSRKKVLATFFKDLVDLEGEMFKDGYYRAFVYLAGPCGLCKECSKLKNEPCKFRFKARPAMEACGIDVYQTARNNGSYVKPLREKKESQNTFCLMLVD